MKFAEPTCKKDVQKLPGKVNYLWHFISNLGAKIESFLLLVRLKHDDEFTWGADQRRAFEKIKEYLSNAPVLRAQRVREPFRLYIAAQTHVIGTVLTQEEHRKEFTVVYVSRHLLEAETRYAYIQKLCLALYHACSKFHHYILSSECMVVCHHEVVKYMLHKPILGGRVSKWVYSLVEYDLTHELLHTMRS
jgi:hypothetical protein